MRAGEGCDEGRQRAAECLFDEALALHRIELASGEHGGDDASLIAKDALFAQALEHRIRCRLLPLQLLVPESFCNVSSPVLSYASWHSR